jgi:hypothetical protein
MVAYAVQTTGTEDPFMFTVQTAIDFEVEITFFCHHPACRAIWAKEAGGTVFG